MSSNDLCGGAVAAHYLAVEVEVVVHVVKVGELMYFLFNVEEQQTLDPAQRPVTPPAQADKSTFMGYWHVASFHREQDYATSESFNRTLG
jgi:hypothetical protein